MIETMTTKTDTMMAGRSSFLLGAAGAILLLSLLVPQVGAAPVENTEYAGSTLVLFNESSAESRELAKFYAEVRGIPGDHLVPLTCSMEETISREAYNETIADPLRAFMEKNELWTVKEVAGGPVATDCKIHIIAIMRGVPVRIAATPPSPTGEVDAAGKPIPPVVDKQQADEASVDSELVMLSLKSAPTKSMGRNPYFNKRVPKRLAGIAPLMLVGRIDGPSWEIAKRLIEDAVASEKSGLWGNAYLDLSRMDVTMGEGYKIGDEWLRNIATGFSHLGIPTYVDNHPERLPTNFPLGDDTIFYFGWYAQSVEGPFSDPDFKFKRGAVACHIHSYSATTIRHAGQWWVGPLVARGAAAALGNVYEPFLTYTTQLDLFNARLLEGYTFAEAAWMATPAVSWMNIMVGDPLYQPFLQSRTYENVPDPEFKSMRLAVNRWRDDPELYDKLAFAADKLNSAKLYEAIGLRYRRDLKFEKANESFAKARGMFEGKGDRLRMDLYAIDALRSQDKKGEALATLRKILPEYQDVPGGQAVQALINQMDPPPPPAPPPAK
jgi:uncharacterized protein (TIGR03790 family)